jgi:hypothetical protein
VRADVIRRWAVVAAGLTVLCAMPVIASALPASVPALTAGQLRARILASAGQSYAGYAESNATFGLPSLPGLNGVASLLDGVTKMRVWVAAPDDWRVDVLSDAGERDTYQLGTLSYIWDSGQELLTEVFGQPGLRLPRPADLVPPALAVRLLEAAGQQARFSLIPALRVAGQSVAGLRVRPADASSTIAYVDIWAEPGSGLPLMVEIFGRGSARPALESQFFQVSAWRPDPGVLTPQRGPGTGFTMTGARSLAGALSHLALEVLPAELAGRDEVPGPPGFGTVSIYGGGLATFVVVGVRTSQDLIGDALSAGGTVLSLPGARGALIGAPLVNAVLVQPSDLALTFLIVGTVSPGVLQQAAATLVADRVWLP